MIRKILHIIIFVSLCSVGAWCLTIKAYYDITWEAAGRISLGDWPGALASLEKYRKSLLSYPIYNLPNLEKHRFRLSFLEGVVNNDIGDSEAAAAAFMKAAESRETAIAAAARYNLALYAIRENRLTKAQSLFNEALALDPNDVGAKINLELVIDKIQARQKIDLPEDKEKQELDKPQPQPGEQWRLDVPDEKGKGSGVSSGQNFL